ncbi:D(2) dopamine receptor-like [Dendronephthya gigantea]|uniref:D(2) dopamine receptor-like n=1 Tax=Dendronephthya gigantea TaxID=151771 RepID=UPI00106C54F7|nr:D(2) dopamine receptor-like [Dendronephthya gigantea]
MSFRSDSCSDEAPPYVLPFFTTALSILFALVTIPGNALVLVAVFRDPYGNLRTPFNYLVLNLAIADLSVGLIVNPLSIIYHLDEGIKSINLPGFGIEIEHVAYLTACTASVLSMASMTADRYVAVVHAARYKAFQTTRRVVITCTIIWLLSGSVTYLYFVIGDFLYRFVFANVVVIFTFCILVFSFFRINLTLRRQRARLNVQAVASIATPAARAHQYVPNMKYEVRVTKMFSIILLWYVVCYLPACIAIYLVNFCHSCSCDVIHWLRDLQLCFLLLSSAVNPYVYAWTSPRFRSAFLKILYLSQYDRARGHGNATMSSPTDNQMTSMR